MSEWASRLDLRIEAGPDADTEKMAGLTIELCHLLEQLNVDSIEPVTAGSAPPGARAAEMLAVGALTVIIGRSMKNVLTELIDRVQWWVPHAGVRRVRIEINNKVLEVEGGISRHERRELIGIFIDQVTRESE